MFGTVKENTLITQKIMLNPNAKGTVTWIAPEGLNNSLKLVAEKFTFHRSQKSFEFYIELLHYSLKA